MCIGEAGNQQFKWVYLYRVRHTKLKRLGLFCCCSLMGTCGVSQMSEVLGISIAPGKGICSIEHGLSYFHLSQNTAELILYGMVFIFTWAMCVVYVHICHFSFLLLVSFLFLPLFRYLALSSMIFQPFANAFIFALSIHISLKLLKLIESWKDKRNGQEIFSNCNRR